MIYKNNFGQPLSYFPLSIERDFSLSKKTQEVNSINIQNAVSATETDADIIGLLTAISVVSKRLASNLRKLQEQKNGGAKDARNH